MIKRYKNELFVVCFALMFLGLNCYNYINQAIYKPIFPMKGLNALSFWYFVRTIDVGEIVLFLSPILICIFSTTSFYKELSSGIYQNILLRMSYRKYIVRNIIKAYIKAILFTILFSIVIFGLGKFFFSDNIVYQNSMYSVLSLPNLMSLNQYSYFLLSLLYNVLFSIVIVNISLIIFSKVKQHHIAVIKMFIILMFVNYGIYFLLTLFSKYFPTFNLFYIAESINIFQGYIPDTNLILSGISLIVWFILSLIVLLTSFKNKQKVFDLYE